MNAKRDPYEVLGVTRDTPAADVRKAWIEAARQHHAQADHANPENLAKMQEINAAYDDIREGQEDIYDKIKREPLSITPAFIIRHGATTEKGRKIADELNRRADKINRDVARNVPRFRAGMAAYATMLPGMVAMTMLQGDAKTAAAVVTFTALAIGTYMNMRLLHARFALDKFRLDQIMMEGDLFSAGLDDLFKKKGEKPAAETVMRLV